jgi:hypothetical protein
MRFNTASSNQQLLRADLKLAPKLLFTGQPSIPAGAFFPTRKALHLLALSVLLMICGNALHAQQCIFGIGYYGGVKCCSSSGCTSCLGAMVHASNGPGSASWKPEAPPCGCIWQLGGSCPPAVAIRKFVREDNAQMYQSRPTLFHSRNGSILWALPIGRPENLEVRERRDSIVPAG